MTTKSRLHRLGRTAILIVVPLSASTPFFAYSADLGMDEQPPSNYVTDFAQSGENSTEESLITPASEVADNLIMAADALSDTDPLDVLFLADTTGSMGGAINNVRSNAAAIMNAVLSARSNTFFGAAEYRDFPLCQHD